MDDEEKHRKAFHFDLSTKMLKEHYPSDRKLGWRRAWTDIRDFMQEHGFKHSQFSGYESIEPMDYDKAHAIMAELNEKYPWFLQCAKAATYTDIGERFDILSFLKSSIENPTPPHSRDVSVSKERDSSEKSSKALDNSKEKSHELEPNNKERGDER